MSSTLQVTESSIENLNSPDEAPLPETPRRRPAEALPWLPCTLALDVQVVQFTVRALLELAPGAILETSCHQSMDIPLRVNGLLLAWTEFEVVGERLAARITDLA